MEPVKISDIKNQALQACANLADKDHSGNIDSDEELSIFKSDYEKYIKKGKTTFDESAEEFNQVCGLYRSERAKANYSEAASQAGNVEGVKSADIEQDEDAEKTGESQTTTGAAANSDTGLSHKSADELKEVKLINKLSLYDVLSEDFLNKEYTEDDEKLKTHMKESGLIYDEMSEEEIQKTVESEKAKRQARFNKDGTYNLEELEDAVYTAVGTDGKLNQSKDTERTESLNATRELNRLLFGNKSIDTYLEETKGFRAKKADRKEAKVVKKVVEYVGGKVEKNERKTVEAIKHCAENGVLPALAAFIGSYSYMYETRDLVEVLEKQDPFMMQQLKDAGIKLSGEVIINIETIGSALGATVATLGTSVALAVLQDLIIGQERPFEKTALDLDNVPIAKVDADGNEMKGPSNDIELFKNYVTNSANNFPNTNTAIALAEKFTFTYKDCDGKEQKVFDFEDFKHCFEHLAGKGSNMNAEELLNIGNAHGTKVVNEYLQRMNAKKQEKENQCCGKTEKNPSDSGNEGDNTVVSEVTNDDKGNPVVSLPEADTKSTLFVAHRVIETVDARKSSWSRLTQCYECLNDVKTLSDRIRILKLAQGVTDGDYSKERMDKLLELNKKYGNGDAFANACKEAGIEFDTDAFKSALNGTCLKNVTLPKYFYDCDRTNDENLAITVTNKGNGPGVAYNAKDRVQYRENVNGAKNIISKNKYDQHKANGAEDENW